MVPQSVKAKKELVVRRIDGMKWTVTPAFLASPGFASVARLGADWRREHASERTELRQRWSSVYRCDGTEVFLKHYLPRSRFERFKYLLRPSRASAEWRNAHALARLGLRVPALLAWGERRGVGGWRQSVLVTEALAGAPTLLEWSRGRPSAQDARVLRRALARGIARMHEHGLFHRDLHGWNILVDESAGAPVPCLLDFHEMLRLPRPLMRLCVSDLARLNGFVEASRWQRFRFVRDYLAARGIHPSQARGWITSVDRATRALWDHYAAKGRDYRQYE